MKKNTEKIILKNIGDPELQMKRIICPNCREYLAPADLEAFAKCPFCSHQFERNEELEDFLLDPIVTNWIRHSEREDLSVNFR